VIEIGVNVWGFLDADLRLIYSLAGRSYYLSGDDNRKISTLAELSRHDFRLAQRLPVPDRYKIVDSSGVERSGFTTPQAVMDSDLNLFEQVFREMEKAFPPLPDFSTGKAIRQKIGSDPLCTRTIVYENAAGDARAIVDQADREWFAAQFR
jgi:hypothetical protein